MRHKLDVLHQDDSYIVDDNLSDSSSKPARKDHVYQAKSPLQLRSVAGQHKLIQSVQPDDDDRKRLSLRARFAIIVGLSLLLWAALIGTAVALLA